MPAELTEQLDRLLKLRAELFSKDRPDREKWDAGALLKYYQAALSVSRNFLYLTPEVAAYLREHALAKVRDAVAEYERVAPFWFVTKAEEAFGEGTLCHLWDYHTLFTAQAWILKDSYETLEKHIDAPAFAVGDLFSIQNITLALEAAQPASPDPASQPATPNSPGMEPPTVAFTGSATDLQVLLNQVAEGTVVVCEQAEPLVVRKTLTITKPMTLRGLTARLPEKLGGMPLLVVEAKGVVLTDLEMHGNYDSVDQKNRAPFIHIKAGAFRVERCRFFDGTKDGINVTPDDNAGDIVGGVIRDIEGFRMGRDVVSLSGGCGGQRVRDVTVENVSLQKGYFRGAVEVSDGTDHITVRHIRAENAVYAIDVQDHGARQKGKAKPSAPNTNVLIEDVTATNCRHVIRTANRPLGHANLTLRNFTAKNCGQPVVISNTTHVRVENLAIANELMVKKPPITHHPAQL